MEDIKDVELLVNEGKKLEVDQLQGVDQAILHSIDAYGNKKCQFFFRLRPSIYSNDKNKLFLK